MIQQAIIKINTEMQKDASDPNLEAVGHYVIDACTTEAVAAAVLKEGKTLAGAIDAMRSAAKKRQKNGFAMLPPAEGFAIINNYFGITPAPAPAPASAPARKPAAVSLDIGDFF